MKVIDPGHLYELESMEGNNPQMIQFIKKELVEKEFKTLVDGTTNEEILDVLIDRLEILYKKLPSDETQSAISHLKEAKHWLVKRTQNRVRQKVEGTNLPHNS